MKLLYITPYYKPAWYFGGPPRCISEQAELLYKNYGYQIDVLTLNLNGNKKLFDTRETVIKNMDGIEVHYLPHMFTPFYNYFFSRQLYGYKHKLKIYDVIHIHGVFNAFSSLGMQMALKANVPFVLTPHGMLDKWCVQKSGTAKFLHNYLFERRLLTKAKAMHFTTYSEQLNSVSPKGVKANIIPYLINFESKKTTPIIDTINDKIRAVFFGRINRKKGLLPFIQAIHELSLHEKQKLTFDIYGNDEENHLSHVQRLIDRYKLHQIVAYKGFLKPEDRESLLKNYDVMVLTSYQENFGITVLEALQEEVPVFISDKVNVADWIEKYDCGWVTFMDKNSMIINLKKLLALTQLQVRIKGKNNRILLENEMNVTKLLTAYKKMYEDIILK